MRAVTLMGCWSCRCGRGLGGVVGVAGVGAAGKIGKIEPPKIHARWLTSARRRASGRNPIFRIEADLIVHLPLLGIAQNVVGFLHVLEAILGGLITRIQIRVIFPR